MLAQEKLWQQISLVLWFELFLHFSNKYFTTILTTIFRSRKTYLFRTEENKLNSCTYSGIHTSTIFQIIIHTVNQTKKTCSWYYTGQAKPIKKNEHRGNTNSVGPSSGYTQNTGPVVSLENSSSANTILLPRPFLSMRWFCQNDELLV